MALPPHHRAVGGFFSAPQERAAYPSFEGGNKSGGSAEDCYVLLCTDAQDRRWSPAGAERCRGTTRSVDERAANQSIAFAATVKLHAGETCLVPVQLANKLARRVSGETLSAREIDVLKLMAQGKSNKEIGSTLY